MYKNPDVKLVDTKLNRKLTPNDISEAETDIIITRFFQRFAVAMKILLLGVGLFAASVILGTFIVVVLYSFYHTFWR